MVSLPRRIVLNSPDNSQYDWASCYKIPADNDHLQQDALPRMLSHH